MLGKFLKNAIPKNDLGNWQRQNAPNNKDVDIREIVDLLNSFMTKSIVYYPSSGLDINDIHYVNEKKIPAIKVGIPNVFIHSDALDYHTNAYYYQLNNPVYTWLEGFEWRDNGNKRIYVKRYRRNGLDSDFWYIYFKCFCNEIILKSFLKCRMKVDLIFCPVDGITSGMGAGGICENVPTLFYPLLAKDLRIKYIITDQSSDRLSGFAAEYFPQWISNINKLHKNFNAITKTDVENIASLTNEIYINDDSFSLCRCPGFFIKELIIN